jgi:hypothetical protein
VPQGPQHQSVHTAYAYKYPVPAPGCVENMQLLVAGATLVHGPCIGAGTGLWDIVTFVPSTKTTVPPAEQPCAGLPRKVVGNNEARNRVTLVPGPDSDGAKEFRRDVIAGRFAVTPEYAARVAGAHVLLVDDTWTSGANMQSAAVALKDAGATRVTALAVVRWLRWDWDDHAALLRTLAQPFDPLHCPVSGGTCDVPGA